MKKILLLTSFLAIGLTSCNKDDDSNGDGGTAASIVGSWEYSKTGVKAGGQEVLENYSNDCTTTKDYFKVNSGGTVNDYWYDVDCTEGVTNGTWTINGNSLTVNIDGGTTNATITQLTSTTLKFEYTDVVGGQSITNVEVFTRK